MNSTERLTRIAELERQIGLLQDEQQALEVEEAASNCIVKAGDVINVNHGNRFKPRISRYRVITIGARFGTDPDIWASLIRKDGTLGKEKRIWQDFTIDTEASTL